MDCWVWQIYFPLTQRTFIVTIYASDLFNLDPVVFENLPEEDEQSDNPALWKKLVYMSDF